MLGAHLACQSSRILPWTAGAVPLPSHRIRPCPGFVLHCRALRHSRRSFERRGGSIESAQLLEGSLNSHPVQSLRSSLNGAIHSLPKSKPWNVDPDPTLYHHDKVSRGVATSAFASSAQGVPDIMARRDFYE